MQEMRDVQVQSLGREDPLEEGMATHSRYSCLENPTDRGAWRASVHGFTRVGHNLVTNLPLNIMKNPEVQNFLPG